LASKENIAILNPLINVTVLEDEDILKQSDSFFSQFRVVCATGILFSQIVKRKQQNNIKQRTKQIKQNKRKTKGTKANKTKAANKIK
jgi:hypothetical protein